jgi:signal transduction histidine kinase
MCLQVHRSSAALGGEWAVVMFFLSSLGDDMRLSQVSHNLVLNALKYTPEYGTIDVMVTFTTDGLSGRLCSTHNHESLDT